ncbi:MAG: AI-2E family transporter [Rickettsiales bacterium]|jgi:predicted PurR-regulated permease PerM|nr:AI-2E family transporter [Rickettsiales bacterium]
MDELINKNSLIFVVITAFVVYFLHRIRGILLPFVLGFIIAYSFKNLVKKYEKKVSRNLLSILVVTLFSLLVALVSVFVFPAILAQFMGLLGEIVLYIENVDFNSIYLKFDEILKLLKIESVKELQQYFVTISNFTIKSIGNLTNNLLSFSLRVINKIFMICISPITAFYFLRDWDRMFNFVKNRLIPADFRGHYLILSRRIDSILHHYVVGQINVGLILTTYYSVLLLCINFKYAFIVGTISGFLTLLPYVGAFGGCALALVLGYFQFGAMVGKLFIILLIFCSGQFLEGNFVTPSLIGNKIRVHPLWLFFGMFVGGSLSGFWGIVISMPLAGVIGVLTRFYFEEKQKRKKRVKYGPNSR